MSELRDYLLGRLAAAEARRVEERLFTEPDAVLALEEAETDLLDDYAADRLDEAARAQLESRLLATERGQQRLAVARVLHARLRPSRVPWRALALAAVLVLAVGLWWRPVPQTITLPADVLRSSGSVQAVRTPATLRLTLAVDEGFGDYTVELWHDGTLAHRFAVRDETDPGVLLEVELPALAVGAWEARVLAREERVGSARFTVGE